VLPLCRSAHLLLHHCAARCRRCRERAKRGGWTWRRAGGSRTGSGFGGARPAPHRGRAAGTNRQLSSETTKTNFSHNINVRVFVFIAHLGRKPVPAFRLGEECQSAAGPVQQLVHQPRLRGVLLGGARPVCADQLQRRHQGHTRRPGTRRACERSFRGDQVHVEAPERGLYRQSLRCGLWFLTYRNHFLFAQASQPGSSLASNPLVMQALQAAQWSAQVGMPASSTTTDPGGFAPSHAYPAMPYVQPPVLSIPHVATPYFAVPGAADPSYGAASAHQQYAQYPLYNGCPGTQEYLEVHQQQLPVMVKPAVRWPPLFETNGGAYVFQAKTGCFLDPTTDFFYDPRAKLYYSGRDGGYYCHDPALSPPFRAFVPPEPTAAYSAHPLPALPLNAPLGLLASAGRSLDAQPAAAVPAAAPVATKVKLGLSGGIKLGGAVGFGGFGLPTSKKVKVDIAKWGALQEDNEDEGKEEGATKAKEKKDESSRDAARVRQAQGPMEGTTKVGSKRPLEDTARAVTGSVSQTTGPPPPPPRAGLPPAFVAPPLPPLPPPAARASPPVPPAVVPASTVATEPATPAKPVCLLCQRQFPSFEMLQRHEKESKLHADNLKKSLGLM